MKTKLIGAIFAIFALGGQALAQASGGTSGGTGGAVAQAAPTMSKIKRFFTGIGDPLETYFLNTMFGPIFAGQTQKTVLSVIVGPINFVIVVLAALLILYNFIWGAASTAHEGELMGRRTHSFWAPVRMALAAMLLIPIPSVGGYNTGQILVAWLVKGSSATATYIWQTAAQAITTQGVTVTGTITPAVSMDVAHAVWNMSVCEQAVAMMTSMSQGSKTLGDVWERHGPFTARQLADMGFGTTGFKSSVATGGSDSMRYFVSIPKSNQPRRLFGVCGAIATPESPSTLQQQMLPFIDAHTKSITSLFNAYAQQAQYVVTAAVQNKANNAFTAASITDPLINANKTLTTDITNLLPDQTAENQKVQDYLTGKNCANTADQSKPMTNISGACTGKSWMGAGGYYMLLARASQQSIDILSSTSSSVAKPTYVSQSASLASKDSSYADVAQKYTEIANNADLLWASAYGISTQQPGDAINATPSATGLAAVGAWIYDQTIGRIEASIVEHLASFNRKVRELVAWYLSPTQNPMLQAVSLAQTLSNILAGVLVAILGMALVDSGAASWAHVVEIPLTATGFIGWIIPMLPYIYWTVAVVGYFIIVAEAIISASVWAVAHIRADGEGIAGFAQAGYMILMSLTLTPVLMIVGFFVGMSLLFVGGSLITFTIGAALQSLPTSGAWLSFLSGLTFVLFAMAYLYWMVIEKTFTLVADFPSRILRWIGHNESPLTRGEEREAKIALAGGTYGVGRMLTKFAPKPAIRNRDKGTIGDGAAE